jgi:hypothetical protein
MLMLSIPFIDPFVLYCTSHRITEDIIAMSRPSTSVVDEYDVLGQFDT